MILLSRIIRCRIIVIFVICSSCLHIAPIVSADTHTAASPSFADVSSAISVAQSGDIVIVPVGAATWDNQLVITKGIFLKGAGIGNTVITSSYVQKENGVSPSSFLIVYEPTSPELNEPFRLTGFSFDLDYNCQALLLKNASLTAITRIRVDHNSIVESYYRAILVNGTVYGVVDNNEFSWSSNTGITVFESLGMNETGWNNLTFDFGTSDNIYFEDNTVFFDGEGAFGGAGGRYCIRHNTFTYTNIERSAGWMDAHGNQGPGTNLATMGVEIYKNTLHLGRQACRLFDHRGGKALVYNNHINNSGSWVDIIAREEYLDSLNPPATNPAGQPQHVSDSYYFNNLKNGINITDVRATQTEDYGGDEGVVPTVNKHFWYQGDTFDGTSGIGVGSLSSRPTTCTIGVGYWATDTKTLYKATATNIWDAYYTPYTYPHPLRMNEKGIIGLSKSSLNFAATTETVPTSQSFLLRNDWWDSILAWDVTDDAYWLSCTPTFGEGDSLITVTVDSSGLVQGVYEGVISVSSVDAMNSPASVHVTLTVSAAGTSPRPFGWVDTPQDGSVVSGSIAVTGWALDNTEVIKVEIKRDADSDDPPGAIGSDGLIYIGDAVFVKGSRPDVEALYLDYPQNDRAGWGYMMLTHGLPRLGNGTFQLYAFAEDGSGHRVLLGTKQITSDNNNRVQPFGSIDTPGQGEIISGNYVNFGWVLTPPPKEIPRNGSTAWISIDGVYIAHPDYNHFRQDVYDAFPGFTNRDGAIGFHWIDTTKYSNGVHNIGWYAVDNEGFADGFGSRFFEIQNLEGDVASVAGMESLKYREDISGSLKISAEGSQKIEAEQLERIKIHLKREGGNRIIGWGADETKNLPIGSTLDGENGVFYWSIGPGFLNRHVLHFAVTDGIYISKPVQVVVFIVPKKYKINLEKKRIRRNKNGEHPYKN